MSEWTSLETPTGRIRAWRADPHTPPRGGRCGRARQARTGPAAVSRWIHSPMVSSDRGSR